MCTTTDSTAIGAMTAFAPSTPLVATRGASSSTRGSTRMCARTPGDTAAPPSTYSQYIDASRLNKAPIINLNAFPNADYNNVSVSLDVVRADQGAAAQIAVEGHNPKDSAQADPALWSKYYSPDTVNQAPFIFFTGTIKDPINCGFGVTFTDVPLQVAAPAAILAEASFEPAPAWQPKQAALLGALMPKGGDNMAPEFSFDPNGEGKIGVTMTEQPGNMAVAEYILRKYSPARVL